MAGQGLVVEARQQLQPDRLVEFQFVKVLAQRVGPTRAPDHIGAEELSGVRVIEPRQSAENVEGAQRFVFGQIGAQAVEPSVPRREIRHTRKHQFEVCNRVLRVDPQSAEALQHGRRGGLTRHLQQFPHGVATAALEAAEQGVRSGEHRGKVPNRRGGLQRPASSPRPRAWVEPAGLATGKTPALDAGATRQGEFP